MKKAAWPFRLWGVRHLRAMYWAHQIIKHYDMWEANGYLAVNADEDWAVIAKIKRGEL